MGYELTEELWEPEAKDGSTVKAGDERARFLVGVPGQTISDEEAARLGLGQPASKVVHSDEVADKAVDGPKASKSPRGAE